MDATKLIFSAFGGAIGLFFILAILGTISQIRRNRSDYKYPTKSEAISRLRKFGILIGLIITAASFYWFYSSDPKELMSAFTGVMGIGLFLGSVLKSKNIFATSTVASSLIGIYIGITEDLYFIIGKSFALFVFGIWLYFVSSKKFMDDNTIPPIF